MALSTTRGLDTGEIYSRLNCTSKTGGRPLLTTIGACHHRDRESIKQQHCMEKLHTKPGGLTSQYTISLCERNSRQMPTSQAIYSSNDCVPCTMPMRFRIWRVKLPGNSTDHDQGNKEGYQSPCGRTAGPNIQRLAEDEREWSRDRKENGEARRAEKVAISRATNARLFWCTNH